MLCVAISVVVVRVFVASFSFKCGICNMVVLILIKLTMQLMPAVLCTLLPSPCSANRLQTPTSYLHTLRNNVINIYASYSRRVKLSPDKHLTFDCAVTHRDSDWPTPLCAEVEPRQIEICQICWRKKYVSRSRSSRK